MSTATRRRFLAGAGALALSPAVAGRVAAEGSSADPTGRYIVDTRETPVSSLESAGLEVIHDIEQVDLAAVRGPRSTLRRVADDYVRDLQVRPGDPPPRLTATRQPESSLYTAQWDKRAFDIPSVHDVTRGEGTRVAILDSGIQADHPDLEGAVNLDLSRSFANDGYGVGRAYGSPHPYHGTVCGGVVAGDGTWLLGTAPAAELVDCRVFPIGQGAYTADYLAAIVHSADVGCDVANLSLGPNVLTPLQQVLYDRITHGRVVEYAAEKGMLVVVAAGNDALDLRRYRLRSFTPGPTTMVVSATGPLGFGWPLSDADGDGLVDIPDEFEDPLQLDAPVYEPALYSNYGRGVVSVSAPGGNYDSVANATDADGWFLDMLPVDSVRVEVDSRGEFTFENITAWGVGTSYAAPQVTAAAALVRSVDPSLSPSAVRQVLEDTATDVDGEEPSPYHGAGFLNPYAAVQSVL